jgi:hypothetical protein
MAASKVRRIRWTQHAARMVEIRAAYKILVGNLKEKTTWREV